MTLKDFMIKLIFNACALLVAANIVSGIVITQWMTLIAASLLMAFLNIFIKPAILVLTIPINIFTLGIFTLFINAGLFYLVSALVKGFYVQDFSSAFWGALLFSLVSIVLNMIIGKDIKIKVVKKDDDK